MEIGQLRGFLAVAEELHFGHAAARLHMAQPPLSRTIQQLERELGVRLFDRTTRSVRLTSSGEALLVPAREILDACRLAEATARAARQGEVGRVRIGFAGPSSHRLVGRFARQVRHDRPGIELTLKSATFGHEAISQLIEGTIDLAIVRWRAAPPDISWRVVQKERYVIVVPNSHRLAEQRDVSIAELRDEAFVALPVETGSDVRQAFIDLCYRSGFAPDIAQVAPDSWTALALVAAGVGITFSVDSAVEQVDPDEVQVLGLRDVTAPSFARLAWRKLDTSPALAQVLRTSKSALPTPARAGAA